MTGSPTKNQEQANDKSHKQQCTNDICDSDICKAVYNSKILKYIILCDCEENQKKDEKT
jgi:hypothetical protein